MMSRWRSWDLTMDWQTNITRGQQLSRMVVGGSIHSLLLKGGFI